MKHILTFKPIPGTIYDDEFEIELTNVSIHIVQRKTTFDFHGFYFSSNFQTSILFKKIKPYRMMIKILNEFRKYDINNSDDSLSPNHK